MSLAVGAVVVAGGEADRDGCDERHDEHECEDLLFHIFLLMPQSGDYRVIILYLAKLVKRL